MNIRYAIKNGELVYIEDVENGLACECICVSCGDSLIARNNGLVKEHHFAHKSGSECVSGYETMLHHMAKEVLAKEKRFLLPDLYIAGEFNYNKFLVEVGEIIDIKDVWLETKQGAIIPDLVIEYGNDKRMFIEIKVTHAVEPEKMKIITRMGVDTIEVSIDRMEIPTISRIKDILISEKENKEWLYSERAVETIDKLRMCSEEKAVISRGFALHIDNCPIDCRVWEKQSYANFTDDCLYCRFNVLGDYREGTVMCLGKSKVEGVIELEEIDEVEKENNIISSIKFKDGIIVKFEKSNYVVSTLKDIWIQNGCKPFLAKNTNPEIAVFITKDPEIQLNKYKKCYGNVYRNGHNIGSREIFGANKRQWELIPKKI